jgi:hypothetical protein
MTRFEVGMANGSNDPGEAQRPGAPLRLEQ